MKYWLALLRVSGVGCKTFLKILEQCSPEAVFTESPTALNALGLSSKIISGLKNPDWAKVEKDLAWLAIENNNVLTLEDAFYPQQLKQISDPPPLLFLRGQKQLLSSPQIAIVGSRNPSAEGRRIAYDFAYDLANKGYTISSGLALGIDACSHQGALKATGNTVAVAGTGLDRVYPASHKALATEIVNKGVMISEFPPGTNAMAANFPRRNRIISGLCLGLLVVEAAKKSGSLITARLALEQNRDVFAVPGSIYNPLARGCNGLIREGAKLVETSEHILEELNEYNQYDSISEPVNNQSELDLAQQNLLNLIMFSPTSVDILVEESGYSADIISSMLLILELQGYISSAAGGGYLRIK
ncbi:MAG: DNA-processing protein DprA [Methylococcales bacterium]|nr:DNA-processing protein DprA [Methylococcales bacterium]